VKFLDIPKVHEYVTAEGEQFFEALQDADDFSIFECKVIQYLIEFRNPLTHEYIMKKNFYPFLFYMAFTVIYCNFIFPTIIELRIVGPEAGFWSFLPFAALAQVMLCILSLYFFVTECLQLVKGGDYIDYFSSIWNYLDFVPPILMTITVVNHVQQLMRGVNDSNTGVAIQAIAVLMIWFKFLYFLRIFKETSSLVRMIV